MIIEEINRRNNMPDPHTRILAATQLQQDKKQDLATLTRAAQIQTNFDRDRERLIAFADQKQLIHTQEITLSRVSQLANIQAQATAQATLRERLASARSLNMQKHREQTGIARSIPKTDEIDTAQYWYQPSAQKLTSPSYRSLASK
jgi:hypothetical protein